MTAHIAEPEREMLMRITTRYACFGLVITSKRVVRAAPIAFWTLGKDPSWVGFYYQSKKGAQVEIL